MPWTLESRLVKLEVDRHRVTMVLSPQDVQRYWQEPLALLVPPDAGRPGTPVNRRDHRHPPEREDGEGRRVLLGYRREDPTAGRREPQEGRFEGHAPDHAPEPAEPPRSRRVPGGRRGTTSKIRVARATQPRRVPTTSRELTNREPAQRLQRQLPVRGGVAGDVQTGSYTAVASAEYHESHRFP